MFSFWFSNLIGLICVITIDFLKPLLRLLISQIVPGQVIMLWSTYNREENWKNPPDNLSPSSMVVRKSLHLRCVVYINYLGDTLKAAIPLNIGEPILILMIYGKSGSGGFTISRLWFIIPIWKNPVMSTGQLYLLNSYLYNSKKIFVSSVLNFLFRIFWGGGKWVPLLM